jgi:two-component system phosphate regulon sensor histidine kinase PhoR
MNSSVVRIFGLITDAASGKSLIEVFRNAELSVVASEAVSSGKPVSRELELLTPIKGIFRTVASPVFENGRPGGCVIVAHDITDLRRLESVRKDFVANVSHELRTPLTAVKGCLETLINGGLDDKEHILDFLKTAQHQASRLENLISDLLNLSSIESGKVVLEKSNVPVSKLLDTVHSGLARAYSTKNIAFNNGIPASLKILADTKKLEQVFINLLDNAAKFTGENGRVTASHEETADGFRFIVEDTGIGIPAKHLTRIFERFYRVDKARSRELGGTGLGLSIVKHLVELHGGRVGVESVEGTGSRFWFTIPRQS